MAIIESSDAGPPNNMALVAIGGQSNGVGKPGLINETIEADQRSYLFTLGGRWMNPAADPMHSTSDDYGGTAFPDLWEPDMEAGIGPARTFVGAWLADNPDLCIGIVPMAKTATAITEHLPGTDLYFAGRRRINQASRHGELKVILWVQGEQDTQSEISAENWRINFHRIVNAWRKHHGQQVIVVLVELGDKPGSPPTPYWNIVKQKQELAARTVSRVVLVKTDGLAKVNLHYTADAQQEIGQRAYQAVKSLLPVSLTCEE